MKLCQKVILDADNKLSTSLWPQELQSSQHESSYERLFGPCELSFHPYALEAWGKKDQALWANQVSSQVLTWNIHIIDDEEHKALFSHLSQNRCLLLLSETFSCLAEIMNTIGFSLLTIKPDPEHNLISISMSHAHVSSRIVLGAALILRVGLDSLLFVRGLTIESSILKISEKNNLCPELEASLAAVLNLIKRQK